MKRMMLGNALEVSAWCLGTMTFGNQTGEAEAHEQMDMALEAGITFWDCAEMYPVAPVSAATVGRSEEILGTWLASRGRRDQAEIATKISGPNGGFKREGQGFNKGNIRGAVEDSLKRLQTDYIDLYQLHWPVRGSYHFRQMWKYDPSGQVTQDVLSHMQEVLEVLQALIAEGKIRAIGLSNETAWGTVRWNDVAEKMRAPRMVSVQNEYSLLQRMYDWDMAETAIHEGMTLLAYSPLATGLLSGKYQGGAVPEDSRMARVPSLGGRVTARAFAAVDAYHALAQSHGVDPVAMALAFIAQRPYPAIPIFGATQVPQLRRILDGRDTVLTQATLDAIDTLHQEHPLVF